MTCGSHTCFQLRRNWSYSAGPVLRLVRRWFNLRSSEEPVCQSHVTECVCGLILLLYPRSFLWSLSPFSDSIVCSSVLCSSLILLRPLLALCARTQTLFVKLLLVYPALQLRTTGEGDTSHVSYTERTTAASLWHPYKYSIFNQTTHCGLMVVTMFWLVLLVMIILPPAHDVKTVVSCRPEKCWWQNPTSFSVWKPVLWLTQTCPYKARVEKGLWLISYLLKSTSLTHTRPVFWVWCQFKL